MGLTQQEQANVRAALRALMAQNGGLALLAARMRCSYASLEKAAYSKRPIGPTMAFRVAYFVGVEVEDVLSGRWPGATVCRHCGHRIDEVPADDPEGSDVH